MQQEAFCAFQWRQACGGLVVDRLLGVASVLELPDGFAVVAAPGWRCRSREEMLLGDAGAMAGGAAADVEMLCYLCTPRP